jgi:hypothetical protein
MPSRSTLHSNTKEMNGNENPGNLPKGSRSKYAPQNPWPEELRRLFPAYARY